MCSAMYCEPIVGRFSPILTTIASKYLCSLGAVEFERDRKMLKTSSQVLTGADRHSFRLLKTKAELPLGGRVKRLFDILFASVSLALTSILFLIVAASIRLTSRGPVFFTHTRVGQGGKEFPCLKFRTMRTDADEVLNKLISEDEEAREEFKTFQKLRNDPRVLPFVGNFLRKTSLDELPQFINVLRGEMSVVGPRPVTRSELTENYGPHASDVLRSRPGITGLWQVSGRSELSYAERVQLDRSYVLNWSFWTDVMLVLRTFLVLVTRKGAY